MVQPIRTDIFSAGDFKDPEKFTLRQAIEWFKRGVRPFQGTTLTKMEHDYLNSRWAVLCDAIATREGIPTGFLSYFLGELAQTEMRLAEEGELESNAAQMYQ